MPLSTPVTRALDTLSISYRVFQHAGPVNSLAQAAQERGQLPEQVVRSLVFRLGSVGERQAHTPVYVMVLMAGADRVSWQALRQYLGVSRITMANEDELREVTGYEIGAVSPFGLPQPMRLLADESVFAPPEISIGSGVRETTVIMTRQDLQHALGAVETVTLQA